MKTSTMMWIGGGFAVWYFFLRNKGTTGQATGASTVDPATSGAATSGPATSGQSVAYELDEPDVEYYGQSWSWQPGWGRSGGGGRRRHGGGGHGHGHGGGHRRR